jgi:hypothetical protein
MNSLLNLDYPQINKIPCVSKAAEAVLLRVTRGLFAEFYPIVSNPQKIGSNFYRPPRQRDAGNTLTAGTPRHKVAQGMQGAKVNSPATLPVAFCCYNYSSRKHLAGSIVAARIA